MRTPPATTIHEKRQTRPSNRGNCAVLPHGGAGRCRGAGICGRLKAAVEKYETHVFHHDDLLQGLFLAHPIAALDALCGGDVKELDRGVQMLRDVGSRKRPLAALPDEDLLCWCDEQPETRYVAMASVITSFESQKDSAPRWTGLALQFLERAPDPVAVLSQFTAQFLPSDGWSGSLASIMEANATLLDQLEAFPALQAPIGQEKTRVQQWITKERSRETRHDRERTERFE